MVNENLKCLLIDDDIDDQDIFQIAVNELNRKIQCFFFNNGIDALRRLQDDFPVPDIIFLDMNMPRMNGLQCLKEMKTIPRLQQTPVILFSTSSDKELLSESKIFGAKEFLVKPSSIQELSSKLYEIFHALFGI